MTSVLRPVLLSGALVIFGALAPRGLAATSCTDSYMECINEAAGKYDDWGKDHLDVVDDLAYVECAAGWVGCVRKRLLGF